MEASYKGTNKYHTNYLSFSNISLNVYLYLEFIPIIGTMLHWIKMPSHGNHVNQHPCHMGFHFGCVIGLDVLPSPLVDSN
jgi:hypothetical protein